ncbi:MAG: hypothetical protein JWM53_182 [bacterium]|nr:hypothetical protein [bacterium]
MLLQKLWWLGVLVAAATAGCSASSSGGNPDGGGGPAGGGSGEFPPGGISFPWPVFDGTVPDVPEATGSAHTWYVDAAHGSDSNDGTSFATAKQTLGAVITGGKLAAGDTVLLGGGVYREYPQWSNGPSGQKGAPITVGSYGRGTGAPILDGGVKPATWTRFTDAGQKQVWVSSTAGTKVTSKTPVLGIYVNSGKGEYALREVIHGQVAKYPNDSLPPNETQANIADKSNKLYYDASAEKVYADFGGTLGDGDPNGADVSILYDSYNSGHGHELLIYLAQGHDYFKFVGLTIRASSWSGVYTESNGHTFDHCDLKFNGGAAILFSYSGKQLGDGNTVRMSRIWMNVLNNWPRFNNDNTSGGWPAAIAWSSQSNGLSEGNVSYLNGGEGMTVGNSDLAGLVSTNNVVRHNVVFDNFSVNMYVNNTQNVLIEQNFVFQHPRDDAQTFDNLFAVSRGYSEDYGRRITPPNVVLGDEPGSAYDQQAHLANITVINNIIAGGKFHFLDYDDGTSGPDHHGLKSCVIANNTWVLGAVPVPGQTGYGWLHLVDTDNSMASLIQDNVFVTATSDDQFAHVGSAIGPGIDDDYNLYAGPGQWSNGTTPADFATWKATHTTWDQHSITGDAALGDLGEFSQTVSQKLVYDWSKATPQASSPVFGAGTSLQPVTTDFTGAARAAGSKDLGALAKH